MPPCASPLSPEVRIVLLEEALLDYIARYGLTDRARAAFRAGSPAPLAPRDELVARTDAPRSK